MAKLSSNTNIISNVSTVINHGHMQTLKKHAMADF